MAAPKSRKQIPWSRAVRDVNQHVAHGMEGAA